MMTNMGLRMTKRVLSFSIIIATVIGIIVGCGVMRKAANTGYSVQTEDDNLSSIIDRTNVSEEYLGTIKLYYDDGAYTHGPEICVEKDCWTYSYSFTRWYSRDNVYVTDYFTYYIPKDDTLIIYRSNKYSGKGYHGGHLIILKNSPDTSYEDYAERYPNGGRLAWNKSTDSIAMAFEKYVKKLNK